MKQAFATMWPLKLSVSLKEEIISSHIFGGLISTPKRPFLLVYRAFGD